MWEKKNIYIQYIARSMVKITNRFYTWVAIAHIGRIILFPKNHCTSDRHNWLETMQTSAAGVCHI